MSTSSTALKIEPTHTLSNDPALQCSIDIPCIIITTAINLIIDMKPAKTRKTASYFYSIQCQIPAIQAADKPIVDFLLQAPFHLYILLA